MKQKIIIRIQTGIFIILVFQFIGCHQQNKPANQTEALNSSYINPIIDKYLADPYIRYEDGYYYLFATGKADDGRFIPIHRSKNLVDWEFVAGAVEQGSSSDWNFKHFWAPEVIVVNNKYYLYYTASPKISPSNSGNRVGLAISDSIGGPYEDFGIIVREASIDGHPFFDKDSTMYMFYTIEHGNKDGLTAGHIYADKMLSPTQVSDNPVQIISHHPWQEGPFMLLRENEYLLTYSCGNWMDSTYHIRYAISSSILGPYEEKSDTIMKSNELVKGPGHHSFFVDKSGKNWIVYHGWDTAHTARYSRIDRVFVDEDGITTDGPTYTRQLVDR